MSAADTHFRNIDRAAYELPWLLKRLPTESLMSRALTPDERLIAEAAESHAFNASSALMHGIEAIGHLLFSTATNHDNPIDPSQLVGLAGLVTHLAVEAQYLQETELMMRERLAVVDAPMAGPAPANTAPIRPARPAGRKGAPK